MQEDTETIETAPAVGFHSGQEGHNAENSSAPAAPAAEPNADVSESPVVDKTNKKIVFLDSFKSSYENLFHELDKVNFTINIHKKGTDGQFSLPISIKKDNIARNKCIKVGNLEIYFSGNNEKQRLKFDTIEFLVFTEENKIDLYYCPPQKIYSEKEFKEKFSKAYENRRYIGMWWFPKIEEQKKQGKLQKKHDSSPFSITITTAADSPVLEEKIKKEVAERIERNWVVFSDDVWRFPENSAGNDASAHPNGELPAADAFGRTLSASIWLAVMHDTNNAAKPGGNLFFQEQLRSAETYVPTRRIDLRPFELKTKFENDNRKKLYYTTSALNSLAVALNSGDHVILTGPPGSGKTELATELPKKLNPSQPFLLCTASPDWTTNELIGHYMPTTRQGDNSLLEFEPGFFIQAIRDGKWLIIDELNRADIDSCMGPLFSVLSGHEVILPYKTLERYPDEPETYEDDDSENAPSGPSSEKQEESPDIRTGNQDESPARVSSEAKPGKDSAPAGELLEKGGTSSRKAQDTEDHGCVTGVERRIGICLEKNFKKLKENLQKDVFWYMVPEDFRIICTMNDSDAGMLNQLSYALQRRFSVIRVEAPEVKRVSTFISEKCVEYFSDYLDAPRHFPGFNNTDQKNSNEKQKEIYVKYLKKNGITTSLINLFANNKDMDLMQLRVVGFGQVKNIITMVIEGLSCPPGYKYGFTVVDEETEAKIKSLVLTLLANGVVMKVFPQLPAFICNRDEEEVEESFLPALICIAKSFFNQKYYALNTLKDKTTLEIEKANPEQDLINDYLEKELKLLFRNQHVPWKHYWEYAKLYAEVEVYKAKNDPDLFKKIKEKIDLFDNCNVFDVSFLKNKYKKLKDGLGIDSPKKQIGEQETRQTQTAANNETTNQSAPQV